MQSGPKDKDKSRFIDWGFSLELPIHKQNNYLTPNDDFFVCSAGNTPDIALESWRLSIEGNGVGAPVEFTYSDLKAMPQKSLTACIECAGNHRGLFEKVLGTPLNKRPQMTELRWELGAIGNAEWTGVPLRHILEKAAVKSEAVHVCPVGADVGVEEESWGVRCPMTLEKALDDDTIIALEMNGEPLPLDHGFPARMIVPGWVGTHSIKWLERILVSTEHIWVFRNTDYYVLQGENWPAENYAPASGAPISKQTIKSSLALSWPALLPCGKNRVHGFARSPDAPIDSVKWSIDNGASWADAEIVSKNLKYAWVQFEFDCEITPDTTAIMTRATDLDGNTQPDTVPFNNGGYLFNMVHPHPVTVE